MTSYEMFIGGIELAWIAILVFIRQVLLKEREERTLTLSMIRSVLFIWVITG
jgi:hypothetical protein